MWRAGIAIAAFVDDDQFQVLVVLRQELSNRLRYPIGPAAGWHNARDQRRAPLVHQAGENVGCGWRCHWPLFESGKKLTGNRHLQNFGGHPLSPPARAADPSDAKHIDMMDATSSQTQPDQPSRGRPMFRQKPGSRGKRQKQSGVAGRRVEAGQVSGNGREPGPRPWANCGNSG
jgi:hypothetical protein